MPFLLIAWGFIRSGLSAALTFFSRPPGSYVGIAIAFALTLWWFGQHEFTRGEIKCEAVHAEATANAVLHQKNAVIIANALSDRRTQKSAEINKTNERVIIHVKDRAEVMPNPTDECVPADLADELRSIK